MRFTIHKTPLPGLIVVERQLLGDRRGYLERLFCAKDLKEAGWRKPISQINHTYTGQRGTVRGMHFQYPPNDEAKLVMCIKGEVYDVAVDLRRRSPTFLHWHAAKLSDRNCMAMMIPEGFAHGFQTLANDTEMLYCHSAPYSPEAEGGVHPQDPKLGIEWPLIITELSAKDAAHAPLNDNYQGTDL